MSEIRGEKVRFRKQDIVALHALPSAQAHDPCIVHSPNPRSLTRRCATGAVWLVALVLMLVAGVVVSVESGMLDRALNERAETALNAALGEGYHADVGRTVVRLTSSGALALKANDVTLKRSQDQAQLLTTDSVFIELDLLGLLSGRLAVSRIEAEGATLASALMPRGKPLDLTALQIRNLGPGVDGIFEQIDAIAALIARSGTELVRIADVSVPLSGPRNRVVDLDIHALDFRRTAEGAMRIDGAFAVDGQAAELHLTAAPVNGKIVRLGGFASGLPTAALLLRSATANEPAFGLDTTATVSVSLARAGEGVDPELKMTAQIDEGTFAAAGMTSEVKPSAINIVYDFARGDIDVVGSTVTVARSVFPFSGTINDLDAASAGAEKGFGLALDFDKAVASPIDVSDPPLPFKARIKGQFLSEAHRLVFQELGVDSPLGGLAGSLAIQFGETSPQINFAAVTDAVETSAVKQLWPWWVGRKGRAWVINNIVGGTVTNAKIGVSIGQGRLAATPGPVDLNEEELTIGFDIADARVNIAGDIPPLRDAAGHFSLRGQAMDVAIKGGTAFFPSGRQVAVNGGTFAIPVTSANPLMAEMKIQVAGEADAIAELISYRPLQALQKTPFKAEDFTGPMTANVGARFGLIKDQSPPAPQWQAEMLLNGVTLKTPIAGRSISAVDGTLRVDPQKAVLDAKAAIDGVPMTVDLVEPVGADSPAERKRVITGTIPGDAVAKFAPGLDGIVSGPIGLDLTLGTEDRQVVKADLQEATVSLPWIGWSKGRGIPALLTVTAQARDGVTSLSDLKLSGDNFGASGGLTLDKAGLASADFTSVKLAAGDDYAVSVKRQKAGYSVSVNGSAADLRPVIDSIKAPAGGSGGTETPKRIAVEAKLARVQGFHSEALTGFDLRYTARGKQIEAVDVSAVTESGQAVVAKLVPSGPDSILQLTSGDAGALARFADIYGNMRGGLLNLKLRDRGAGSWRGTLDLRKFSLVDEARLQSMVSAPSADGRSLNQAVKKNIDVSTARFERGFANLALDGGRIEVANGVVRGTDVGATFQGIVRDPDGQINMTGTFMPAYGLNRLFGELPLIGTLLGNGRDRGLLGITFKVTGSFAKPNLVINPLSIIAPGVFRNIFEFQ